MADTQASLARPQPIGVFGLPAGYLLIPDGPGHDAVRSDLVAGRRPAEFPETLRWYAAALDGNVAAALRDLEASANDLRDPVVRINRLVLDGSADDDIDTLERDVADDPALSAIVRTLAFVVGRRTAPPPADGTDGIDGEVAAMVHAAHATLSLERHDGAAAVEHLEAAAQAANPVSKALAGQLMGQLANAQLDEGGVQRAAVTFQAALDALADTDLNVNRAELHVAAGAMFQEMSEAAPRLMQQAIDHYHQALALIRRDDAPETFAIANANLGLAYVTMPMQQATDQLRMGVAVQSMREALTVLTPETHRDRWSSTMLNLANALVYLPSSHQAENIAEAVELYEQVLAVRDRQTDPQGRARVLANQGNALAHLGALGEAKARLHEARALFEEFEEHDAVRAVRSVLDEIVRTESLARQDSS